MHVEDLAERPVGAWLLACRLLRDEGNLSTWTLGRRMHALSEGLYGGTLSHLMKLCRRLEAFGILTSTTRQRGRSQPAFVWALTTTGREWLDQELDRVALLLGLPSPT